MSLNNPAKAQGSPEKPIGNVIGRGVEPQSRHRQKCVPCLQVHQRNSSSRLEFLTQRSQRRNGTPALVCREIPSIRLKDLAIRKKNLIRRRSTRERQRQRGTSPDRQDVMVEQLEFVPGMLKDLRCDGNRILLRENSQMRHIWIRRTRKQWYHSKLIPDRMKSICRIASPAEHSEKSSSLCKHASTQQAIKVTDGPTVPKTMQQRCSLQWSRNINEKRIFCAAENLCIFGATWK